MLRRTFGTSHCDVELWDDVRDPEVRGSRCFSAADYRKLRFLYPRLASIGGHSVRPYSDLEEATQVRYWTFVRDPIVRCASHYQFQVRGKRSDLSFREWIERDPYRNFMTKKIAGADDLSLAKQYLTEKLVFVGVVEKFADSLETSLAVIPWRGGVKPERKNVSPDDGIKNELLADPESMRLLREANELDLQLYDYVVQELYPAQRERLGREAAGAAGAAGAERAEAEPQRLRGGDLREKLYLLKRKHVYRRALRLYRRWHVAEELGTV